MSPASCMMRIGVALW